MLPTEARKHSYGLKLTLSKPGICRKSNRRSQKEGKGSVKGSVQENLLFLQQHLTSGLEGLGKAWGQLVVVKGHPGFCQRVC